VDLTLGRESNRDLECREMLDTNMARAIGRTPLSRSLLGLTASVSRRHATPVQGLDSLDYPSSWPRLNFCFLEIESIEA
jgi:hypothetical protein